MTTPTEALARAWADLPAQLQAHPGIKAERPAMTDALREAAQAVLDRWDSPKWEWVKQGPTADLMAALRAALSAPPAVPPTVEAAHAMGAQGGPAVEGERLAFEAWMRGHCWALCATWNGTEYRSDGEQGGWPDPQAMRTRQLWAAWRDRAALAASQPPAAQPESAQPVPPSAWDEYAMREAERLWSLPAMPRSQLTASLHVALVDAMRFAAAQPVPATGAQPEVQP